VGWEDIDDILYEGTKEQITNTRCPDCGGYIKYSFSSLGENRSRFVTECLNCHTINVGHKGPMPNCVKYFGIEGLIK
jgi:hypothetical protein